MKKNQSEGKYILQPIQSDGIFLKKELKNLRTICNTLSYI